MNTTRTGTDRIEREIELDAPIGRVWRALTDHEQFGEWFQVKLDDPFVPGRWTRGQILYSGCEHMVMEILVEKIEPERLFSFRWPNPAEPIEPGTDTSGEPLTLVEFRLEPTDTGTRLTVTESGFDSIPADRREKAFRMNSDGWTEQMRNISAYVETAP